MLGQPMLISAPSMLRWRIAAAKITAGPGKIGSTVPMSPIAISTRVTLHQKSSIVGKLAVDPNAGEPLGVGPTGLTIRSVSASLPVHKS